MIVEPKGMILNGHPDGGHPGLWAIGFWEPTAEEDQATKSMGALYAWLGKVLRSIRTDLPNPQDFVDTTWDSAERDKVITYLRFGRVLDRCFGYSTCRFKCGIEDQYMGNADMTDGTFVWSEGFVHYLEKHNVRPPQEFVRHVLQRSGR